MEDEGWISSFWGESENNRRAKYYRLTKAGMKQLKVRNYRLRSSFKSRASFPRYLRGQNVARLNSFGALVDIVRAPKREDYKLCERPEQVEDDVRRMWQETEKKREQVSRPPQGR